jgi:hypothetical protein
VPAEPAELCEAVEEAELREAVDETGRKNVVLID